ncbi:scarecrow-like protein 1 [Rutidosis leptorrhynchoides]|uniref:scarecrow-like protein 1 n=1 Tax=Rutidosis leptorrhynchoides TaxID=125765 RepID=UPI003A9A3ADF
MIRSVSPYGNRKVYLLNGSNESSINNNNDHQILYTSNQSYSDESYDPSKYFLDSINEEHESNLEVDYILRDNYEGLSYDEDKMRLKLQELEQVLLDDASENIGNMEIEREWGYCINESPKESSSNDSSYVSSISSTKDVSVITPRARATTPKELLFECALAVSEGNIEGASNMINELRQTVSIDGEPSHRILAYMVEALAARVAVSGKGLYKALKCKEPPSKDRLSAMQVLFEVCPCFRFGFTAANGAILEAFVGEKNVHIIDFDINQGSQYITLLQTLADQNTKPHLRLTGVDDPESVQRPVGGLNHIGLRLKELAQSLNIDFEFNSVAADTMVIEPKMLNCRPGEAVIVNFAFQLHHMPDESVTIVNQRDQLLRMVKSLNPKLVTVVEQDVNTNTAPFLHRFHEAYSYYSAMFDCLEATLPRESQERVNVEKQCLARDIVNIIACEGEERIERYEVSGKWKARMMMAGFRPYTISTNVNEMVRKLIKQYSERYKMKVETNAVHFGWEDKVLIVASAWC